MQGFTREDRGSGRTETSPYGSRREVEGVVQYRIDDAQEASEVEPQIPYNYCHSAIRRQQFARL